VQERARLALEPPHRPVVVADRRGLLHFASCHAGWSVVVCEVPVQANLLAAILREDDCAQVHLEGRPGGRLLRLCGPGWAAVLMGVEVVDPKGLKRWET